MSLRKPLSEPAPVPAIMDKPAKDGPDGSWPAIDAFIAQLIALRNTNGKLRDRCAEWEGIADTYFDAACEWEAYAGQLADWIAELEERA
jgi:hypothetical protein